MIGTIKHWRDDRGFGFIRCDAQHNDVFIHERDLPNAFRYATPQRLGVRVEFDVTDVPDRPQPKASNVTVLSEAAGG